MVFPKPISPIDENGEGLPSESKLPQKNAAEIIANAKQILTGIIDAVATQEYGNTEAKADIKVNGTAILKRRPSNCSSLS
jgi:hypothetical protein